MGEGKSALRHKIVKGKNLPGCVNVNLRPVVFLREGQLPSHVQNCWQKRMSWRVMPQQIKKPLTHGNVVSGTGSKNCIPFPELFTSGLQCLNKEVFVEVNRAGEFPYLEVEPVEQRIVNDYRVGQTLCVISLKLELCAVKVLMGRDGKTKCGKGKQRKKTRNRVFAKNVILTARRSLIVLIRCLSRVVRRKESGILGLLVTNAFSGPLYSTL